MVLIEQDSVNYTKKTSRALLSSSNRSVYPLKSFTCLTDKSFSRQSHSGNQLSKSYLTPQLEPHSTMPSSRSPVLLAFISLSALAFASLEGLRMTPRSRGLSFSKRNPPLNCASYQGGDACYDPKSGVPICVDAMCRGIQGGDLNPGDPGLGDCNRCTCASRGGCKLSCPPDAKGPNGQPCSELCHPDDCICNLSACLFTITATNQGGGPNMAAETG